MAEDPRRELDPNQVRFVQTLSTDAKFVWLSEEIKAVGKSVDIACKRLNVVEEQSDKTDDNFEKHVAHDWWVKPAIIALALGNIGVVSWIVYAFVQHLNGGK